MTKTKTCPACGFENPNRTKNCVGCLASFNTGVKTLKNKAEKSVVVIENNEPFNEDANLKCAIEAIMEMGYYSNTASNSNGVPDHEDAIMIHLMDVGFVQVDKKYVNDLKPGQFIWQPYGSQRSPDILVNDRGTIRNIESKTSTQSFPKYNSGLPERDSIYVFSSDMYNQTTVFMGKSIVSDSMRKKLQDLLDAIKALVDETQNCLEWEMDNPMGWMIYPRKDYCQRGGQTKTDYFKHKNRKTWEKEILDELGSC